jgi:hypothetical protein
LLEGPAWLFEPDEAVQMAGKSGLAQACQRPGWEVMPPLHEQVREPLALETTPGAWQRRWGLVILDGSTLKVADEKEDAQALGRRAASRSASASPPTSLLALAAIGGNAKAQPIWRLVTTIPHPAQEPLEVLATLDQQRWEIETALQ